MRINARPLMRAARPRNTPRQPQTHRAFLSTGNGGEGKLPGGTPGESPASEQAVPLGPYYQWILNKPQPIPEVKPEEPPNSSPKSPRTTVKKTPAKKQPAEKNATSTAAATKEGAPSRPPESSATSSAPETSASPASAQEKARIIFGSRLVGPAERADRLEALRRRSTLVAGVVVPPRPEEPDNCCMSGCVNCVWDRFRDEMEDFVVASAQAERALQAQRAQGHTDIVGGVSAVQGLPVSSSRGASATSMDDDGGGSDTNWQFDELKRAERPKIAKDLWDDDLYKNVPVGIREFMKQEKRLKEKHNREGTFGA